MKHRRWLCCGALEKIAHHIQEYLTMPSLHFFLFNWLAQWTSKHEEVCMLLGCSPAR